MEVVPHAVDAKVVDGVTITLGNTLLFSIGAATNDELLITLRIEETWNLAGVEEVAQVLDELLHENLIVCEEEDCGLLLNTGPSVELSQVVMEGLVIVTTGELNLEALITVHVGCQPKCEEKGQVSLD